MKIRIIKTRQLNRRQLRALSALINNCNHNDGTHYGFPFDADCYYILYEREELIAGAAIFLMGEQLDGLCVYEIAAFTASIHRRRQHFNRLLAAMRPKLKGSYAKYAVYDNADAAAALNALQAKHSHDELMMTLDLDGTAYEACKASGINVDLETGHAYSECSECYFRIDNTGSNAYVFGVQTYANCLRQGHAYTMLCELFDTLHNRQGVISVSLQVSSENTPALKLYHKLGMQQSEKISLYYVLF